MQIKKFRTKYHKYLFQFDYSPFIVEKVKEIQASLPGTWKDLNFNKDEEQVNTGWVFSSLEAYDLICEEFEPIVNTTVEEELETLREETEEQFKREEKIAEVKNKKLKTDLKIPTKIPLFPFQVEAVDFVEKVGGRALIADDMGMGKTIEAIGYGVYKRCNRVLVICPASVKGNWRNEIEKFGGIKANVLTETENRGGWEIIGYSNLDKYWDYIRKEDYQLIVVDECHYIKSRKAKRTKKVLRLLKGAEDTIFLTGTPILNRPAEIYNIFNFITPMEFWTPNGFGARYCGLTQTPYGYWDFSGSSNLDELKERMSWMIRRNKKEVLEQLPDKTINVVETKMKDWSEYKQILKDFKGWIKENDLNKNAIYAEALTKVSYLKQVVVKNKDIKGELDNLLEAGRKVIVFSQYKTVINELSRDYFSKSVILTGDTPESERQKNVDRFQSDDSCKVFFSTIKAGGVGITLTEADVVLFTDLSWTPADHEQAEDRAYRIGQKNNVKVYYLITPKTIEEKIWKMLKRKETMIKKIMEGEKARKVHIKTLIKNL
jgi:SWI/SNF-related matrix-associated actin-dependent regulator 1 of chromatin subfamily A